MLPVAALAAVTLALIVRVLKLRSALHTLVEHLLADTYIRVRRIVVLVIECQVVGQTRLDMALHGRRWRDVSQIFEYLFLHFVQVLPRVKVFHVAWQNVQTVLRAKVLVILIHRHHFR